MTSSRYILWLSSIVVAVATVIMCYRSPYSASDMEVVPDSVEYCAGAYNILAHGEYEIEIQRQWYPPRYAPWFSAIFLMPVYIMAPLSLGAPIILILLMSILAVYMAFRIGYLVSGTGGAILAASFLLLLPIFRNSAMAIMTDAPCTALCLVAAYIYLRLDRQSALPQWLIAGLVCALAASLRPLTAFLCLPFVVLAIRIHHRQGLRKCLVLLLPSFVMGALTLLYNYRTFGSALRNGYSYWCAVPYDYFALTFGLQHVSSNAAHLLLAGRFVIPALLLLLMLWGRYGEVLPHAAPSAEPASRLFIFCAVSITPLTLAHLLYFFPEQRFFLPLLAYISVLTGAVGGVFFRIESRSRAILALSLLIVIASAIRLSAPEHVPSRRMIAERIDRYVPDKATVISAVDPAYLALMLRHREIRFLQVSRGVEYASKLPVIRKIKVLDPSPRDSSDHRAEALLKNGGEEAVRWTANEILPAIIAFVHSGKEYYVDTGGITLDELTAIRKIFESCTVQEVTKGLYRLVPPNEPSSAPED